MLWFVLGEEIETKEKQLGHWYVWVRWSAHWVCFSEASLWSCG